LRYKIQGLLLAGGIFAAKAGLTPNVASGVGFLLAIIAGVLYYYGTLWPAAISLLGSGIFDALDGAIARATARISKFGGVLDSVLDRAGEIVIYSGVILGGLSDPILGLATIGLSLLVSYSRARVEAEGLSLAAIGIAERPERLLILLASTLVGQIQLGLLIISAISAVTLVQRLSYAYRKLSG